MADIDLRFTTLKRPLPDFVYDDLRKFVAASNNYYSQPDELRKLIAGRIGVPSEMIYLTAGIDQAIQLLVQRYGQATHIFTPTYVSYKDAESFGHELHQHNSFNDRQYRIDTTRVDKASLIFLANPNNPFGLTAKLDILDLVSNNTGSLVIVDEAYAELAGESVAVEVPSYENLVVLRSFSKGYSLAGFRIGYMIASSSVIKSLALESTWFNVAYASVGAAIAALNHEKYFVKLRQEVIEQRDKTEQFLVGLGFDVIHSDINAAVIHFASESAATEFVSMLESDHILVNQGNGGSNIGLDKRYVRISVGTPEEMSRLREHLKRKYKP